jgi:DNA-binding transcriptional regulator YiaG
MTRSFSELTKDLSPERRERIEQRKEQLRQEMTLAELRRAFSLTQDTLARTLNVKQAEISKIENRADMPPAAAVPPLLQAWGDGMGCWEPVEHLARLRGR